MSDKHYVITIERQYGSGGRIVGRKLAEELGLHFYDDEILKMASEKSAVGEEFFRLADEKAGNNLFHRLAGAKKADVFGKPSLKGDVTSPDNLFKFQAMVMRELAEQEPCVFVGRAAGYVLDQDEEIEYLVRIFVYADRVRRVQRVRKIENERKNYYKYFTGNDWKNMKNYDLPINTTRLGLDETAELIKEYVKLRGYMK